MTYPPGRRGSSRAAPGAWTQQGSKLVGSDGVGMVRQGHSVALSADGTRRGGWPLRQLIRWGRVGLPAQRNCLELGREQKPWAPRLGAPSKATLLRFPPTVTPLSRVGLPTAASLERRGSTPAMAASGLPSRLPTSGSEPPYRAPPIGSRCAGFARTVATPIYRSARRKHDLQFDRQRSGGRHRGAPTQRRKDRCHSTIDDPTKASGKVAYAVLTLAASSAPSGRSTFHCRLADSGTMFCAEAYEVDVTDDDLRHVDEDTQELDWGKRDRGEHAKGLPHRSLLGVIVCGFAMGLRSNRNS